MDEQIKAPYSSLVHHRPEPRLIKLLDNCSGSMRLPSVTNLMPWNSTPILLAPISLGGITVQIGLISHSPNSSESPFRHGNILPKA